jgi:hypothetical protein
MLKVVTSKQLKSSSIYREAEGMMDEREKKRGK